MQIYRILVENLITSELQHDFFQAIYKLLQFLRQKKMF